MVKFNKHTFHKLYYFSSFNQPVRLGKHCSNPCSDLPLTDRFHQRPGDGGVHLEEQRHHQVRHHPRRRRHLPHHVVLQPQLLPQRTQARLPGSFQLLFMPTATWNNT